MWRLLAITAVMILAGCDRKTETPIRAAFPEEIDLVTRVFKDQAFTRNTCIYHTTAEEEWHWDIDQFYLASQKRIDLNSGNPLARRLNLLADRSQRRRPGRIYLPLIQMKDGNRYVSDEEEFARCENKLVMLAPTFSDDLAFIGYVSGRFNAGLHIFARKGNEWEELAFGSTWLGPVH